MRLLHYHWVVILMLIGLGACRQNSVEYKEKAADPEFMHRSMKQLTDVIVHDIFSPPVASRIYAYSTISAYEALLHDYPEFRSMAGQLNGLEPTPAPDSSQVYCFPLAAVQAFLKTGKTLIFSEDKMVEFHGKIMAEFKALGIPKEVIDRSIAYGDQVSAHILAWSTKDKYKETRTFPKYTIQEDPGTWKPTPPSYMEGIEPHWRVIRPMVLSSLDDFAPPPPTPYSSDKKSRFFAEAMEVYQAMNAADSVEREAIARFWDCNPYVSHQIGHVMYATKKITPGGHWMGITAIAARKAKSNVMQTAEAYARVAISLLDGFISCWEEKYRSNLVRPETVINSLVDDTWAPLLQTPPFPEYTSGHSVISRSAATALTALYGDNFSYTDSVEVEYGFPPRSFNSFLHASEEAAMSRLYGGIHYRPAIENGVQQGGKIGQYIVEHLKTRKG